MQKSARILVLSGVAVAALGASAAAPAAAAVNTSPLGSPKVSSPYDNVRLVKVWGTKPGKDVCITMGGSKKSGAVAKIARCSKNSTQRWTLKGSGGTYSVRNKHSGKCLSVAGKKSGTAVRQRTCSGKSKPQRWVLSGSKIINKWANKAITAETSTPGRKLTITKYNDSKSKRVKQEWGT